MTAVACSWLVFFFDDALCAVFPSFVGRLQIPGIRVGMDQKDSFAVTPGMGVETVQKTVGFPQLHVGESSF